jgi:hypothetical protein
MRLPPQSSPEPGLFTGRELVFRGGTFPYISHLQVPLPIADHCGQDWLEIVFGGRGPKGAAVQYRLWAVSIGTRAPDGALQLIDTAALRLKLFDETLCVEIDYEPLGGGRALLSEARGSRRRDPIREGESSRERYARWVRELREEQAAREDPAWEIGMIEPEGFTEERIADSITFAPAPELGPRLAAIAADARLYVAGEGKCCRLTLGRLGSACSGIAVEAACGEGVEGAFVVVR